MSVEESKKQLKEKGYCSFNLEEFNPEIYNTLKKYYVLPAFIVLLLGFFVYVLFHVSSIQLVDSKKVFQILKSINSRNGTR